MKQWKAQVILVMHVPAEYIVEAETEEEARDLIMTGETVSETQQLNKAEVHELFIQEDPTEVTDNDSNIRNYSKSRS